MGTWGEGRRRGEKRGGENRGERESGEREGVVRERKSERGDVRESERKKKEIECASMGY